VSAKPPTTSSPTTAKAIRRERGGWTKLLRRSLLLAAPFAVFLVAFDWRFSHLNPSHYSAKRHLLESQASRTEVLVMGPSHALVGIEPAALGRPAFNLAGNSQSLYYDLLLIRKYRAALKSLKVVVLVISPMSLDYELDEGPEKWRCYYYKYFYDLPHRDWHMRYSARNFSAWFLCGSEISRASVLFGTCSNALTEYDPWGGWTNRPRGEALGLVSAEDLSRAAESAVKRHLACMRPENRARNLSRLESLVYSLRSDGIQVLLVSLPVTRFYRERLPSETYRVMQETLADFTIRHQVTYKNHLFDDRFNDSDFQDGDHLNSRGAARFSELLAAEIAEYYR
jgi:hypothetical protein